MGKLKTRPCTAGIRWLRKLFIDHFKKKCMVFARYPVLFVVVIIRFAIQAFNFDANFITYRYGTGQISVCFVGIFAHR